MTTADLAATRFDDTKMIERNFKLLSHHELNGFGGMGEGMSVQIAPDGRRILWLAHESSVCKKGRVGMFPVETRAAASSTAAETGQASSLQLKTNLRGES